MEKMWLDQLQSFLLRKGSGDEQEKLSESQLSEEAAIQVGTFIPAECLERAPEQPGNVKTRWGRGVGDAWGGMGWAHAPWH